MGQIPGGRECAMIEPLEARLLMAVLPPGVFDNGRVAESVVTADFDGDGKLDLAVSAGNQIALLRGRGNGKFRPAAVTQLAFSAGQLARGNFGESGGAELVSLGKSGNAGFSTLRVLRYDESERRLVLVEARRIAGAGYRIVAADVVGDSIDEIVVTAGDRSKLFELQESESTFNRLQYVRRMFQGEGTLVGPAIGDLDGDGRPELVYADIGESRSRLIVVRGSGEPPPTFSHTLLEEQGSQDFGSVFIGDVDGDGLADVLFTMTGRESVPTTSVRVILNAGDGPTGEPLVLRELDQDLENIVDVAEIVGLGAVGEEGWREVFIHRITRTEFEWQGRSSTPLFITRETGGTFAETAGYTHHFGNRFASVPLMIQGDFAADGRPDVIWGIRSRVRVIPNADTNVAPTVEKPRGPFQATPRGGSLWLGGRPMDAEFLLGRAAEPMMSFYLDTNNNGRLDESDRHMVTRHVFRFALGQNTGTIVTVGLNWEVGTFNVFARAVDEEGLAGQPLRLTGGRFMGRVVIT